MNLSAKYRDDIRILFAPSAPKNGAFLGTPSMFALANLHKLASSLHIALGGENYFESLTLYFADRLLHFRVFLL